MTNGESDALLTVKEVSQKLHISERQIRRLVARGELRALRIGRRVLIDPHDLTDFLESCRTA